MTISTTAEIFIETHNIVYADDIAPEIARFGGRVISRENTPFGGVSLTVEFADTSRAEVYYDEAEEIAGVCSC